VLQTEVVEIKHFMLSILFTENRAVHVITWTNTVKPNRPQMTIWLMPISCWIP